MILEHLFSTRQSLIRKDEKAISIILGGDTVAFKTALVLICF